MRVFFMLAMITIAARDMQAAEVYYDDGSSARVPDCWVKIEPPCEEGECEQPLYHCCNDIYVTDPKECRQQDCFLNQEEPRIDRTKRQQDLLK